MDLVKTYTVANEVVKERKKQHAKWGEQNLTPIEWIAILTEELGEASREAVDDHFDNPFMDSHGCSTTKEGQARRLSRYREELVQLAAVSVQALESFDRQNPEI